MTVSELKAFVPRPIRTPLSKLRAVFRRLTIWRQVATRITGLTSQDQKVLSHAIRSSPFTVWRDLDKWQFPMVDAYCTVSSTGIGQFRVRANTDDLFHVLPGQEPAVESVIRTKLRPGDVFVDAGSNIGYYTIVASKLVGTGGSVIACEMMPETAQILREHVAINDAHNVTVVEAALSDAANMLIEASHPEGKFGQASISRGIQGCQTSVRTTTLEIVLSSISKVHIMKMDLEGAELNALKGLGESLNKIEAIVFENRDGPEVARWLEAKSFVVRALDGNNALAQRTR